MKETHMNIFRDADIEWKPADNFTGNVQIKRLVVPDRDSLLKVYRVEFEPEARTNWHRHSGVQLLYVIEGRCRVQKWDDEDVKEIGPGDAVYIAKDEKHWHGAAPGSNMTHIAVIINAEEETEWMERVAGSQYQPSLSRS